MRGEDVDKQSLTEFMRQTTYANFKQLRYHNKFEDVYGFLQQTVDLTHLMSILWLDWGSTFSLDIIRDRQYEWVLFIGLATDEQLNDMNRYELSREFYNYLVRNKLTDDYLQYMDDYLMKNKDLPNHVIQVHETIVTLVNANRPFSQ